MLTDHIFKFGFLFYFGIVWYYVHTRAINHVCYNLTISSGFTPKAVRSTKDSKQAPLILLLPYACLLATAADDGGWQSVWQKAHWIKLFKNAHKCSYYYCVMPACLQLLLMVVGGRRQSLTAKNSHSSLRVQGLKFKILNHQTRSLEIVTTGLFFN